MGKLRDANCGFTLIELLAVMAIMMLLLAMTMGSFIDWGRGASMRSSLLNANSAISFARQSAVTRREITSFVYANSNMVPTTGYYYVTNSLGLLSATNFLERGVIFEMPLGVESNVRFKLDGSCYNMGVSPAYVRLSEIGRSVAQGALTGAIKVLPLTGHSSIVQDY